MTPPPEDVSGVPFAGEGNTKNVVGPGRGILEIISKIATCTIVFGQIIYQFKK